MTFQVFKERLDTIRNDLNDMEKPILKDQVIEQFSELNIKEKESKTYIKCVNLQIIQSEFNKKMIKLLNDVEKLLTEIVNDVNEKLDLCENIELFNVEDVIHYIKEKRKVLKASNSEAFVENNDLNHNKNKMI